MEVVKSAKYFTKIKDYCKIFTMQRFILHNDSKIAFLPKK